MKKLIITCLFLSGCGYETEPEKFDRFMSELSGPVILISKTLPATDTPSITVRDSKGIVRTFSFGSGFPVSVSLSRNVGDTLKP